MQRIKNYFTLLIFLWFCAINAQIELPKYPICNDIVTVKNVDTLLKTSDSLINQNSKNYFCLLNKALQTANATQRNSIAIKTSKISSILYKEAKFKEAVYYQSLTAKIWFDLDSINNYTTSLRRIGFDYYRLGDVYNTVNYINKALILSKKNNQKWEEYLCYYQLAWANWRINNCDEALRYIQLSKQIIDQGAVKKSLGSYYNSISNFYMCKGDAHKALTAVNKALTIIKKNSGLYGVALTNKANYLIENKADATEIIALIFEGLAINKAMNDLEQLESNYGLLAKAYIYNKQYNKAIKYALKSEKIAGEIGDLPRVLISYTILKMAYTKKSNFQKALIYSEKHTTLNTKLYGTKNSNRIFTLQKENAEAQNNLIIKNLKKEKELSVLKTKQTTKNNWLISIISLLTLGLVFSYFSRKKHKNENSKQQLSHELLQMEMTALRARMNPHFLFNSLNSIKSFIATNKPREASNYLSKFATLVRMILDHSKEKTISLTEELKAVKYYIDIEKLRLKNTFNCELYIDDLLNLNEILIPPSILQPFIENAIWHGFANIKEKGLIEIRIFPKKDTVIIEIEDNGIGRVNAKKWNNQIENKKSSGIKIIDNIVTVYKTAKMVDLNIEIIDLYVDKNTPKGTKVCITIKNPTNE